MSGLPNSRPGLPYSVVHAVHEAAIANSFQNEMAWRMSQRANELPRRYETDDDRFERAVQHLWPGGVTPSERAELRRRWDEAGVEDARQKQEESDRIHESDFRRKDAKNRIRLLLSALKEAGIKPRYEKVIRPSYKVRGTWRKHRVPEEVIETPLHYPLITSEQEQVKSGVTLDGDLVVLRRNGNGWFSSEVVQHQDHMVHTNCGWVAGDGLMALKGVAERLGAYASFRGIDIGEWISPQQASRLLYPDAPKPPLGWQGWYPDPSGRHQLRWWDGPRNGAGWTESVRDAREGTWVESNDSGGGLPHLKP